MTMPRRWCRRRVVALLLSTGLLLTFLTSIALIVWHERTLIVASSSSSSKVGGFGGLVRGGSFAGDGRDRDDRESSSYSSSSSSWPPVLSAYVESPHSTDAWYDENDGGGVKRGGDARPRTPLPRRRTTSGELKRISFGHRISYTSRERMRNELCRNVPSSLPVDEFGYEIRDPYLPWIHDLFASHDGEYVEVIGQNRRRCHKGRNHAHEMRYWEGQVSLFQPVAVRRLVGGGSSSSSTTTNENRTIDDVFGRGDGMVGDMTKTTTTTTATRVKMDDVRYRLSNHEEADVDGIETRFICVFKSINFRDRTITYEGETLSYYPFNYEYVNWRKGKNTMVESGKEQSSFWLSPLSFRCPLPHRLRGGRTTTITTTATNDDDIGLVLDVVPMRTPVRRNDIDGYFFHDGHGGPMTFNATLNWGTDHVLPRIVDSGRWENLPVCFLPMLQPPPSPSSADVAIDVDPRSAKIKNADAKGGAGVVVARAKPHRLVACTWTSAMHQRRGNERRIVDGKARLREWITFNLEVGFDHVYVFDNTGANASIFRLRDEVVVDHDFRNDTSSSGGWADRDDLSSVTDLFPPGRVTRIDWPATVCNNNRPAHDDPGERSSQYAAEAACRSRYGPYTDWMASMDPDEYFVPMGNYTNWKQLLDKLDGEGGQKILKFRSTRARPLLSTLVPTFDEGAKECTREMAKKHNQCLAKAEDRTYLETYNCEYIKSPKPERFSRAMKQFYRPDFVLLHYVHYSTVTTDLATEKQHTAGAFTRHVIENPKITRFIDELEEGVLIHAKTTVPAETFSRDDMCVLNAPSNCLVGIPCPDDVEFNDALHTKNVFRDENGKYCNCWMNRRVVDYWLPKLNAALGKIGTISD